MTEELKRFMQEGLDNYAPACVALSEFRRQVRSRLQSVLDDFSGEFSAVGLDVALLKPAGAKLDDEGINEKASWIGLRNNQSAGIAHGCYVGWNLDEPVGQQLWATVWIYLGRKADRVRLFSALEKQRSPESKSVLDISSGNPALFLHLDLSKFYNFDAPFRSLVQEWLELLSGVGGVQAIVSAPDTQT